MRLGAKRELFSRLEHKLRAKAYALGYEVFLEEVKRGAQQAEWNATHCAVQVGGKRCEIHSATHEISPELGHDFRPIGILHTVHGLGLAVDYTLRRNGRPLWSRNHYEELGEYWESLHELCAWGGRFGDPCHFSLKHGGRK